MRLWSKWHARVLFTYGVAVLAIILALLVQLLFLPVLGELGPYLIFLIAVMVSAAYGGLGPGLLATVFGALLADYFLTPPYFTISVSTPRDWLFHGMFTFLGAAISWLNHTRRLDQQRALAHAIALGESEARFRHLIEQLHDYAIYMLDPQANVTSWNASTERITGYRTDEILGQSFTRLFAPEDIERGVPQHLLHDATTQGHCEVERWQVGKDGGRFYANVVITALHAPTGQPSGFAIVLRDITERKQTEVRLRQYTERLKTLHDLDRAILTAQSSSAIAAAVLAHVRRLTDCEGASITLIDVAAGEVEKFATHPDQDSRFPAGTRRSLADFGDSHASLEALARGTVLLIPDIQSLPSAAAIQDAQAEGWRSFLNAPLLAQGELIGTLNLFSTQPHAFVSEHIEVVGEVAAPLAIALRQTRLLEQIGVSHGRLQVLSHQLLQLQEVERRHLAAELHDEVGGQLTGISLLLSAGSQVAPDQVRGLLARIQGLISDLINQVRDLALELRPPSLDDLGLRTALEWLFERYTAQTGIHVRFEQYGLGRRLPANLELAAYRIIQEALTNVARHAEVSEVAVRCWIERDALSLEVNDTGRGFDCALILGTPRSAGLLGMLERAALMGGHLQIESATQAGTQVSATLPLTSVDGTSV
jgi:PAS domain S-box-containing protein